MIDFEKDKELEALLASMEIEALLSLANGILKLGWIYKTSPEKLKELGIYVLRDKEFPPAFLKLLENFNPSAYETPLDRDTAVLVITDFFSGIPRPRVKEEQATWFLKNLRKNSMP